MTEREEYLKKMRAVLDRLQVKASLAKLELRDLHRELGTEYDHLLDRLSELGESTENRWDALRQSFDAAWTSFKRKFDEVMAEHDEDSSPKP